MNQPPVALPCARFELDIIAAFTSQLIEAFDGLRPAALNESEIEAVAAEQGVYQLLLDGTVVYVGKAERLSQRLRDHARKVSGRLVLRELPVAFRCLYVQRSWIAAAPEALLIRHHQRCVSGSCEWNGSGFGAHDPGRRRETTNKPPEGFDQRYPIDVSWRLAALAAGRHNVRELLLQLKSELPFLLRFQTADPSRWRAGHPEYNDAVVELARSGMSASEILQAVVARLAGWQATAFPDHVILYKERRDYAHGDVIWRHEG